MMEVLQPTTSGFLSLDILKLLQTSCTHSKKIGKEVKSQEFLLYSHFVLILDANNISPVPNSVEAEVMNLTVVIFCVQTLQTALFLYAVTLTVINLLVNV